MRKFSLVEFSVDHPRLVVVLKTDYNIGIQDSLFTERFLKQPPKKWIE